MDWDIGDQDNTEDDIGSRRVEGMDALLFALALEVALLQMQIVEGCGALRSKHQPAAERNTPLYLAREKLANDRKEVTAIIRSSLVEVLQAGTWRALRKAIYIFDLRSSEHAKKRTSHIDLRRTHMLTMKNLKENKKQNIEELRQADRKITFLRDKKEDEKVNAKFRLAYAEKWLDSRVEQLELQLSVPRMVLPSSGHEQRVHDEIQKAYELQLAEREQAVEYWRLKYANDTAKINELLAVKREQLRITTARREELQALFNLHAGEMRSWLTFKRERAARLAREARNRDAATKIQSWWRGEMVRHALGPFKHLRQAKKSATKTKKK